MRYLVIVMLLLSCGCECKISDRERARRATEKSKQEENTPTVFKNPYTRDLMRYEDKELGIVCYRVENRDGISCMRKPSYLEGQAQRGH